MSRMKDVRGGGGCQRLRYDDVDIGSLGRQFSGEEALSIALFRIAVRREMMVNCQ
jgi:hypothetical protein